MTAAQYTPRSSRASGLDEIAQWIGQRPERTGVYAFVAARTMEREGLPYRATFDRCLRAAMEAGLSEASGRRWIYRGFAYAAAGHIEPPTELEEGGG
jgi:hypothetical protein